MFTRFYKKSYSIDENILLKLSGLLTGSSPVAASSTMRSNSYNSSSALYSLVDSDLLSLQCEIERLKYALKSVTDDRERLREEIYKLLHVMSEPNYPKYNQNFTARSYEMHYELLKTFLQRERLTNEKLLKTISHKPTADQSTQTQDLQIFSYNGNSQQIQIAECIQKGSDEILIFSIDHTSSDLVYDDSEGFHSKAWSTAETSPIPNKFINNLEIEIDDTDGVNIHKPPFLDSKGSRKSSIKHIIELDPIFRHTEPPLSTRGFSKDTISNESMSYTYCNLPNFSPISVDNPFNFYIDEDLECSFNPKERDFSMTDDKVQFENKAHNHKFLEMPKPSGDQNSYACSPSWSENSTPKLNSPETSYSGYMEEWSSVAVDMQYKVFLSNRMYSSGESMHSSL